ncbi:type II secretion system protein [Variovorax sp. RHLX14]|uniref:type II secretion system protein n=1 Tax=Variovorax sp. RHLX14 TaxID=1259731 RepID=UPI003F4804C3
MTHLSRRRQRGLSLVEVAIASVILGACGVMLWAVIDRQAKVTRTDQSATLIDRVNDAMLAYGYLHGRLPCPSPLTTGKESCDGKDIGFLPFLTLGLPDAAAGRIRYQVSMVAPSPVTGSPYQVVVAQEFGEAKDLAAQVVPLASVMPGGHEPLLDLCETLGTAADGRRMAYALTMDPGGATMTPTSTAAPAAPATPVTAEAVAHTVGRAQFAARLHCSTLSVAGRAQFNTALAADTMARAMRDVVAQFGLVKFTYAADTAQGAVFASNAAYSLYRASTKTMAAQAAAEASVGKEIAARNLAVVKMVLAGAYVGATASNLARFVTNEVIAESREGTLDDLLVATNKTAADLKARAILGNTSAFFLEDKWLPPAP